MIVVSHRFRSIPLTRKVLERRTTRTLNGTLDRCSRDGVAVFGDFLCSHGQFYVHPCFQGLTDSGYGEIKLVLVDDFTIEISDQNTSERLLVVDPVEMEEISINDVTALAFRVGQGVTCPREDCLYPYRRLGLWETVLVLKKGEPLFICSRCYAEHRSSYEPANSDDQTTGLLLHGASIPSMLPFSVYKFRPDVFKTRVD